MVGDGLPVVDIVVEPRVPTVNAGFETVPIVGASVEAGGTDFSVTALGTGFGMTGMGCGLVT